MRFDRFEIAVLQLASRGVKLTAANVAAHLGIPPAQAEAHLDRMAQSGRLEVEVDERLGVVRYRAIGLDPASPFANPVAPFASNLEVARRKSTTKNVVLGAMLGLLLPGFGLLYAAPASVAIVAGLLALVAKGVLASLPLVGGVISMLVWFGCGLGSAALAVLYVRQYNRYGERTHLEAIPALPF